jgi:starch phosphorylase
MALGHFPGESPDAPFNMAVMGLRLAAMSNGVSLLHGQVSREMFQPLWPNIPADEAPIGSVTNGVHPRTWVSSEMNDLLTRHVVPAWDEAGPSDWARVDDLRDDEVWRVREQGREALVAFVRDRLRQSLMARGVSASDAAWADDVFDSRVLTIGFARRFAAYKRATLLLSQPERLKALLLSPEHPMQLVFAGKAHPADDIGKEMIRQIVQFSRDPEVRHRIVFVEDYDIAVARMLYQGSDVWLNTPRRPMEASGTSGEKAALNGALNLSIVDGWWAEMFDGTNGWAISSAESYEDLDHRDRVEADSLFEILERQVVPLFYDRSEGRIPHPWVRRIKSTLRSLGPRVVASRMVRDYVEGMYEPTAARFDVMSASEHAKARAFSTWKQRVVATWPAVRVIDVDAEASPALADLGSTRKVSVLVALGDLEADDVAVQLLHGQVGPNDELISSSLVALQPAGVGEGGHRYEGGFVCERAGRYGIAVRVVPAHPDLVNFAEMDCVAWA